MPGIERRCRKNLCSLIGVRDAPGSSLGSLWRPVEQPFHSTQDVRSVVTIPETRPSRSLAVAASRVSRKTVSCDEGSTMVAP